jgi:hypothetical protein
MIQKTHAPFNDEVLVFLDHYRAQPRAARSDQPAIFGK